MNNNRFYREEKTSQDNLSELVMTKMPFGKYKGRLLIDLPEDYIVWFARKGFPKDSLGEMIESVYEIKINGLEYLLEPLKQRDK